MCSSDLLDYVGVLAVEFFICAGELMVNELAPRPHNSGHFSLDACDISQFEQQVRALTGLQLHEPRLLSPVAMLNLLGERWQPGPPWSRYFTTPGARVHLYGKGGARPGRKMGHINILAETADEAARLANILGSDKTRIDAHPVTVQARPKRHRDVSSRERAA